MGVDPSATSDAPQGLPRRGMSEADDTVTGVAVLALCDCRCGRPVVVSLTGAVCACGVRFTPGEEEP